MIRPTSNVGLISKILGKPLHTLPDRTVFLLLEAEDVILGLAVMQAFDDSLAFVDAEVLGKYLNEEYKDTLNTLAKELVQFVFNTKFIKVVVLLPDSRKHLMGFFQRGGFRREGVLKNSYNINGVTEHQTILGIDHGING